jgi:hypothetical protein
MAAFRLLLIASFCCAALAGAPSGYDIRGRFVIDGPEPLAFSRLFLKLGAEPVKISLTGEFHVHLTEASGHYIVQNLPDDWYVETATLNGKRLVGTQFAIEPGTSTAEVIFLLSPRGGSLLVTTKGPEIAVMVVLLHDRGELSDQESIRLPVTDGAGRFMLRGVAPGTYRIFTLDAASYPLLSRPDLLVEKFRSAAPLILMAEGDHRDVALPVLKLLPPLAP